MTDVMIWLLTTVHVIVALVLVILVLMQKSHDQGVGATFGGGVTESVFGAGTTSALVKMTIWCAGIMLGTTLILAILHSHRDVNNAASISQKVLQSAPPQVPSGSATPMLPGQPMGQGANGTLTPSSSGVQLATPPPAAPVTPDVEKKQPAAAETKP